jgi:hypothetical protein
MKIMGRLSILAGFLMVAAVAQADLEQGIAAVERRDWAAALAEFQPLAEGGDAAAQVNIGNLYMKGLGVDQDYGKAFHWYLKAAEQEDAIGQGKLGLMHFYGLGVREDHAEAAQWFRKAAEQGEPGAAAILGSLYAAGDGVEQDKVQAYVWYTLAADHDHRDALESKNGLVDEMSPGEISEALDRLAEWGKRHPPAVKTGDAAEQTAPATPKQNLITPKLRGPIATKPGKTVEAKSEQAKGIKPPKTADAKSKKTGEPKPEKTKEIKSGKTVGAKPAQAKGAKPGKTMDAKPTKTKKSRSGRTAKADAKEAPPQPKSKKP